MSGMLDRALAGATQHVRHVTGRSISSSVISGSNPTEFDASNPIILFIIQLFIIIVVTQGLGWAFKYIKQPRVIAEVIGGILLGPTALGRIPGFSATIFPTASISYLSLIANIGLILFLFLVGLEVDIGVMKKNGRSAALISVAGMVVPFGLGSAIAIPIYNNFVDTAKVSFGHFLLFVDVAFAITAFPVLCRILTATKLLDTKVGVIVLAAGVGNDVVGWVLLALTLALVNASAPVTAVYILLCAVGWAILLLWPIKKGFRWLARRTGSMDGHGPTPGMMIITLLLVFTSAFLTGVIGVHPIFGGFIAGLIIPHEGRFAIALVEKIDDLVSMLFLPIYFVISGLQTNLGLLDTGYIWAYVILICVVAWVGKFFGCGIMAKVLKYSNRESGAIGMLMSCKGLVELIVLNVGLSAGIINQQLFSMFVVEAVVLTFITTPFTLLIYPEKYRTSNSEGRKKNKKDLEGAGQAVQLAGGSGGREYTSKFLVVLQKIEHLAPVMLLAQMLEPPATKSRPPAINRSVGRRGKSLEGESDDSVQSTPAQTPAMLPLTEELASTKPSVQMDALRLIELTGRTHSVMQSAEKDQLLPVDDALQLFKHFGRLRGLVITPHISIIEQDSYPNAVVEYAEDLATELVLVPWTIPVVSGSDALIDSTAAAAEKEGLPSSALSPWEGVFATDSHGSPMYTHFLRRVFAECPADVALFVDRGFGSSASFTPGGGQHIFMPFFGGPDDRLALRLVVQLCQHTNVTASVVRIERSVVSLDGSETSERSDKEMSESMQVHQAALQSNQLTVGPTNSTFPETAHRFASDTADNIAWTYFTAASTTPPRSPSTDSALQRISFWSTRSPKPLTHALDLAESSFPDDATVRTWRPLLVVLGRSRRGGAVNHGAELAGLLTEKAQNPSVGAELRKTVGDAATGMMLGGGRCSGASYIVLETGSKKGRGSD